MMTTSMTAEMTSGFTDRVLHAQTTFRAVMDATARPGRVQRISVDARGPSPLMPASAALALTLFDQDTPVWLDETMPPDVARWIVFHTSAPIISDPAQAAFALIGDASRLTSFNRFAHGNADYPDRSTTLVVQVETLTEGPAFMLRGPGIDGVAILNAPLWPQLIDAFAVNRAFFPRGIDCVLVAGDSIIALPRTTQITATGG